MRSLKILLIAAMSLFVSIATAGNTNSLSGFDKGEIGVVNLQKVFQSVPQIKVVNARLEKQFKPRRARIVEAQKALNQELKAWSKESTNLSIEQRSQLQDKILGDKTNIESLITGYQRHLAVAKTEARSKLLRQVSQVVKSIAKEKNLKVVLQENTLIYTDTAVDITSEVIKRLNKI